MSQQTAANRGNRKFHRHDSKEGKERGFFDECRSIAGITVFIFDAFELVKKPYQLVSKSELTLHPPPR
jgi:hypothetical protein